ncbi:MAG: hypothetical protein ACYSOF_01760 [Planctomycetota bacterium]|jgi:adenylate cyclase class IV
MKRYAKCYRKEVEIEKTIPLTIQSHELKKHIFDFLTKMGYRDISDSENIFIGVRGLKFWTLFNIGDPRRNYHIISIEMSCEILNIVIKMDSWYGLGTEHDISVFVAEIEMLKTFLETECLDYSPLNEAQKKRRKSDWMTFFILLGVSFLIAVLLISIVIYMDNT